MDQMHLLRSGRTTKLMENENYNVQVLQLIDYMKEAKPSLNCLARSFFLSSNGDLLALQSAAIVLGALSSTRQALNVAYPSITLNLLQSPYSQCIEPPL